MPLFMCRKCGCVENTALGDYWLQNLEAHKARKPLEPLCSACLPGRTWHGEFDRKSADGYVADKDGRFIYSKTEAQDDCFKNRGPFKPVELPKMEKA